MEIVVSAVFMDRILSSILAKEAPYKCEIVKKVRGRTYLKVDTTDSFKNVKRNIMGYIYQNDPQTRVLVFAIYPVINGKADWLYFD